MNLYRVQVNPMIFVLLGVLFFTGLLYVALLQTGVQMDFTSPEQKPVNPGDPYRYKSIPNETAPDIDRSTDVRKAPKFWER